jgi:shikimate dehydrogenase
MVQPKTRELNWKIRGLSVTAPHKSAVLNYLDWIASEAREIGAVNTIVIDGSELRGYNTDSTAFIGTLVEKYGQLRDAHCAIIGAGGAARSVLTSLRTQGARATVFARNEDKAESLAKAFGSNSRLLNNSTFKEFDVVINASPLGTRGVSENETPAVASQLRGTRLAYDLVYNPLETRFIREAKEAGCETLGGLAMLIAQAVEQFKLWTGIDAPVAVMHEAATLALAHD